MITPFFINANKGNSVMGVAQFIGILIVGGFVTVFYGPDYLIGQKPTIRAVSASTPISNIDVSGKSLEVKEKVYKLLRGIALFCQNIDRISENRELESVVVEVIVSYKLENEDWLQPTIMKAAEDSGLKKNAKLADIRENVISSFNGMADSVRKSIETDLAKEKK